MTIALTLAFAEGDPIGRQFACNCADRSPPPSAQLAVAVEDPDAPGDTSVRLGVVGP